MSFPHNQRVTPIAKHVSKLTDPAPRNESGDAPARTEVRLRVKSTTADSGYVDGAWWPRSRQPTAEFPELVLAMSSWVGPVRRVAYHIDDWDPATRELTVEGWLVILAGLSTLQANTVVVAGTDQRRMCLLVVPPDTPGDIARSILSAASGPNAVDTAEEILTQHGVDVTAPSRPRP